MASHAINIFKSGVHNLIDPEVIPVDAAQDAYNWITQDGAIELARGKVLVGAAGVQGEIQGEGFGYKVDGTTIHWRKTSTKIQYFNGTAWTDVITGLTDGYYYWFVNYQSLAGTFTYAFGLDGIYKMHNANPTSYNSMYDSAKNFKFAGAIIDKGRTIAWGQTKDKTGLYLSYIDTQKTGTVYTQVPNETIGSGNGVNVTFTGTLAFKAGGATRNSFAIVINDDPVVETFTDNYDGTLTGSLGGTGTINYMTGAFSVTFNTAPLNTPNNVKASYQWEDSNALGVTDFTKSSTRVAGEGAIIRQDEGGDPILAVKVGLDGSYYSLKRQSAYQLTLDAADVSPTNVVFRRGIGIQSAKGSVSTQRGIIFMNTANQDRPICTILQRNPIGDNVEPLQLFPQFSFQNYTYDECVMEDFDRFVAVSCKSVGADNNDTTLLLDIANNKVDITGYGASTYAKDGTSFYMGSSLTESVYKLYDGFDDDTYLISNYWTSKDEIQATENLKKCKKLRIKGLIQSSQSFQVYEQYDNGGFALVGTVLGTGSYVDSNGSQTIGANLIGSAPIGGGDSVTVYPYYIELRLKTPKYRARTLKFVALGFGYVNIQGVLEPDLLPFEGKIPKRYRQKNYVSLDGEENSLPNPEF